MEAVDPSLSLREHLPGARDLKLHESLPPIVHLAGDGRVEAAADDLGFVDAKLRQLVERDVDAVARLHVLAHVPQDVGELVGETEGERSLVHLGQVALEVLVASHDGHGHEPHGARHAVAVLVELVEGSVPGLHEVHSHAVDHVAEGLDVHGEPGQRIAQRGVDDVRGPALEDGLQAVLPLVQSLRGDVARVGSVDELVGSAAPDVDGPDGALLLRRHELGAEVEGLGVLAGDLVASLVRGVEHGRGHPGGRDEDAGFLPGDASLEGELLHLAAVGRDDVLGPSLIGGGGGRTGLHDGGHDGRRGRAVVVTETKIGPDAAVRAGRFPVAGAHPGGASRSPRRGSPRGGVAATRDAAYARKSRSHRRRGGHGRHASRAFPDPSRLHERSRRGRPNVRFRTDALAPGNAVDAACAVRSVSRTTRCWDLRESRKALAATLPLLGLRSRCVVCRSRRGCGVSRFPWQSPRKLSLPFYCVCG